MSFMLLYSPSESPQACRDFPLPYPADERGGSIADLDPKPARLIFLTATVRLLALKRL